MSSVARRILPLPADVAFDRLTALRNHERLIPLTTIVTPDRRPVVGDVTVATTAWLIDDTMELVAYHRAAAGRGGRAQWVKRGPVVLGEAEIIVTALGVGACRVEWVERDIHLAGLPAWLTTRALTAALGLMTAAALARFARLSAPRHG